MSRFSTISPVSSSSGVTLNEPALIPLSGAIVTITDVPTNARRVVIEMKAGGSNANNVFGLRLGDAGGIETTGYEGAVSGISSTVSTTAPGDTFWLYSTVVSNASSQVLNAKIELNLVDATTNTWSFKCVSKIPGVTLLSVSYGVKSLSGTLTTIALAPDSGAFDEGVLAVSWFEV